jgi:hypothetical protein
MITSIPRRSSHSMPSDHSRRSSPPPMNRSTNQYLQRPTTPILIHEDSIPAIHRLAANYRLQLSQRNLAEVVGERQRAG